MEPAVIPVWKLWTVYAPMFAATAILSCVIKIRGLFKYTKWRHLKMSDLKLPRPGVGYQHNLHFYGSVGPLECIFLTLLALFNEGVPAPFFHLVEAPMMRLPNVKILLCWPSTMHIYGFV